MMILAMMMWQSVTRSGHSPSARGARTVGSTSQTPAQSTRDDLESDINYLVTERKVRNVIERWPQRIEPFRSAAITLWNFYSNNDRTESLLRDKRYLLAPDNGRLTTAAWAAKPPNWLDISVAPLAMVNPKGEWIKCALLNGSGHSNSSHQQECQPLTGFSLDFIFAYWTFRTMTGDWNDWSDVPYQMYLADDANKKDVVIKETN